MIGLNSEGNISQANLTAEGNLEVQLQGGSGGANGRPGKDGKSAYEIAVENGFIGTEEEWLASLKGEKGDQGTQGKQGQKGVDGLTTKVTMDGVTHTQVDGNITLPLQTVTTEQIDKAIDPLITESPKTKPNNYYNKEQSDNRYLNKEADINKQLQIIVDDKISKGDLANMTIEDNSIESMKIKDKTLKPEKTSFIDVLTSRNLFNKDDESNKKNLYLDYKEREQVLEGVGISHRIYVNPGQVITFFYCADTSTNWGLIYDKNNKKISTINAIGTTHQFGGYSWQYRRFIAPEGAHYIRINYTIKHDADEVMCVVGEYPIEKYIPYSKKCILKNVYINKNWVDDIILNPLENKTVLTFGDSVMYGAGGSVGGFAKIIAEKNNMKLLNKAKSGYTICVSSAYPSRGSILKEVEKAIKDNETGDYILIEGGFNDVFNKSKCPLGNLSSDYTTFDENTFTGALEKLLKQALIKWYDKKILFILGHNLYRSFNDLETPFNYWIKNQNIYWDRAIEVCKKWNVPYLDMRLSGFIPLTDELLKKYFAESNQSTHPNDEGYKLIYVDKVTNKMKQL